MNSVTATIRNGRIECDEPLPEDWPEGTRITLTKAEASNGARDINDSTFPEELEHILKDAKEEELKQWESIRAVRST